MSPRNDPSRWKTHCTRGHPFDESNTVIYHRANGTIMRTCRACIRYRTARARVKKRRYYGLPTID